MNLTILTGNIAKIYNNDTNARMMIADNYKEKATFIPVSLYGPLANHVLRYMEAGDHVSVVGRVSTYKTPNGEERVSIIASRVSFEGYKNPRKALPTTNQEPQKQATAINPQQIDDMSFIEDIPDDDCPF